jgi:hypothetical protein
MLKKTMLGLMALCFAVALAAPSKASAQVVVGATIRPANCHRAYVDPYASSYYDYDTYPAYSNNYPAYSYDYTYPAYNYSYAYPSYSAGVAVYPSYYGYGYGDGYWRHRRHEWREHRRHEWREHEWREHHRW